MVDYDGAGNVVWSVSGLDLPDPVACNRAEALASGRVVQRTYDTRQRLKTLTFPDGRGNQAWTYTPDGLAAQIATTNSTGEAAVVNRYRYNARRLLVAEDLEQQGVISATLRYDYNANGHLSGQHWPQNLSISFAPNARGQATQVGPFATGVRYYANGAVREFSYGNGVLHQMTQNARQLPARSVDAGIIDLSTSYDASGNVASIVDGLQGSSHDRQMQYDGQNRLTAVHSAQFGGDGWFRFGYDALDNIRTWSRGGAGKRFFYDGNNRLQSVTDDTGATIGGFSYDVQGNLKNKNGRTFDFDHGNRLRGTGSERYRYDGHGRRTSTIGAATSPRQFMYANSGTLSYAHDQGKNEHTQYIHLAGSLLAIRASTGGAPFQTRYQHTDALGSPVAETSSTGQLIERTEYEPYGGVINRPLRDGPGYTGHVTDASTGLSYMQQRYMDPELGMFLSVDPMTAYQQPMGQFNRYRYGNNSPYNHVDLDGRQACGKDTSCRLAKGDAGWSSGAIPRVPAASSGSSASSSTPPSRWDEITARLGLKGDLTKNGNIFDVEALAHDLIYPLMNSPGGYGVKFAGVGVFAATVKAEGQLVFKTAHYASRLESAGLDVARTEAVIAREIARIQPSMAAGSNVAGRVRVNGVVVEYRVRSLPDGGINVGTIFPVK